MANKTITIAIIGPEEVVTPSLEAFARKYGWHEAMVDAEGEPVTKESVARLAIRQFIMDTVKSYNIEQAQIAAAAAAEAATSEAIDLTALTLTVG